MKIAKLIVAMLFVALLASCMVVKQGSDGRANNTENNSSDDLWE